MKETLSRDELIDLVDGIRDPQNDDEQIAAWLAVLAANVPHPAVSDLIFWPDNYGLGPNPASEEIVDKALSYRPIEL